MTRTSPETAGVGDLFQQLIEDGREVARTEVALQKAKLQVRVDRYRTAAIWFAVAGVLALAALIALLVGLILALATLIGPLGATAVVCGVVLAIAAISALLGRNRLAERPADDQRP